MVFLKEILNDMIFNRIFQVFDHYWDGFVDETCREQMPKAAACLYGELGKFQGFSSPNCENLCFKNSSFDRLLHFT